ncbi:hypothetical protein AOQ84DRAFT_230051, partial [Glonium stellatum]
KRLSCCKTQESVDSGSNSCISHLERSRASRTLRIRLPSTPSPERWQRDDERLAFVFASNYRLDCGCVNGACRVRPRLGGALTPNKSGPEKNDAAPKRVGSHIPDLRRVAATRSPNLALSSASSVLEAPSIASPAPARPARRLEPATPGPPSLSPSLCLPRTRTSRRSCLTATSRTTARPIPRGHAASQPSHSPTPLSNTNFAVSPQLLGLEWLTKRYCRCELAERRLAGHHFKSAFEFCRLTNQHSTHSNQFYPFLLHVRPSPTPPSLIVIPLEDLLNFLRCKLRAL